MNNNFFDSNKINYDIIKVRQKYYYRYSNRYTSEFGRKYIYNNNNSNICIYSRYVFPKCDGY